MAVYKNSVPFGNIVTDGLVLNLDATNINSYPGSGTTWTDTSFYRNNGTLTNGPTFLRERGRGSIVFDGVNDFVSTSQSSSFQFSNSSPFTISVWVRPTGSGDFSNVVSYALGSGNFRGYYLSLVPTASIYSGSLFVQREKSFIFDYYDGSLFRGIMGNSNSITFDSWVMLTATSATNNVNDMKLYQNGVLVSYVNRGSSTPNNIDYTGVPFRIGSRENIAPYNGNISTVQIYNRALSAQEVQQNYNALKSRFGL